MRWHADLPMCLDKTASKLKSLDFSIPRLSVRCGPQNHLLCLSPRGSALSTHVSLIQHDCHLACPNVIQICTASAEPANTRRTRLPALSPVATRPMMEAEVIPASIGCSSVKRSNARSSNTPRRLSSRIIRYEVSSTISFTSSF